MEYIIRHGAEGGSIACVTYVVRGRLTRVVK